MLPPRTYDGFAIVLALVLAVPLANEVQAETPPGRSDHYGDALPAGAIARLGTVRWRHPGVARVVYARDGKTIYSVSEDLPQLEPATVVAHELRQWDAVTGCLLRRWNLVLDGHDPEHEDYTLDIERKKLAYFEMITLSLYDLTTKGKARTIVDRHENFASVVFSPDGKTVASRSYRESWARLWDMATGREIRRLGELKPPVGKDVYSLKEALAFSADGKRLAVADEEGILRIFDVASGAEKQRTRDPSGQLHHPLFAPNGQTLAWESEDVVCLWDVAKGRELRRHKPLGKNIQNGRPRPFAFSPDSKLLATGEFDGSIRFWQVEDGRELRHTPSQPSPVAALDFSPDGRIVVAALEDALRLWDVATGAERPGGAGHTGGVASLAFALDGRTVLTGGWDKTARIWDISGRQRHNWQIRPGFSPPVFSPDGHRLAFVSHEGDIRVQDTDTGRELAHSPRAKIFSPLSVSFVSGGNLVAYREQDGLRRLWDVDGGTVRRLSMPGEGDAFPFLYYSLDGTRLAVERGDRLQIVDTVTGRQFSSFQASGHVISRAAFAPDGRSFLTVQPTEPSNFLNGLGTPRQKRTLSLLEVASGQERCRFQNPPGELLLALALSPDGRLVSFGGAQEPVVFLWDLAAGKLVGRLLGHDAFILALAFSRDGRTLASASRDTTVLLWDVAALRKNAEGSADLSRSEREQLWARLSDRKAAVAYRAMIRLSASPRQCVPLLSERLPPVPIADAKRVRELFVNLDSAEFAVRDAATRELDRLGESTIPTLRTLLADKPSLEVRRHVEMLLEKWDAEPLPLQVLRALEVLEQIGNAEARKALELMAKGASGSRLTREAAASLQRLSHRLAAQP